MNLPKTKKDPESMTLREFNESGKCILIWKPPRPGLKPILDEPVLFCSDHAEIDPDEFYVVFRVSEVIRLWGSSPDHLRSVFEAKKVFGPNACVI